MSDDRPGAGQFTLKGLSVGGIETSVVVPTWKLALDVGRGRGPAVRCRHLALTHTHLDHAGGLPYVLALKQLFRMEAPNVYVPAQMAEPVRAMIEAWDRCQRQESRYRLVPVEPGRPYPLGGDLELEPFRTHHPVPSVGYTVLRSVDKLKAAYKELPGPEIGRLRKAGEPVTERVRTPLLSATGDTLPEALDRAPLARQSRTLLVECTFLDDRKGYEDTRAGGHVHLRDLLERAEDLRAEHLVLKHFSQIYGRRELPALLAPLARRLPGRLWAFPMDEGEELLPIPPDGDA